MKHGYNIKTQKLFYHIELPLPHLYYTIIKVLPLQASYCLHCLFLLGEEC